MEFPKAKYSLCILFMNIIFHVIILTNFLPSFYFSVNNLDKKKQITLSIRQVKIFPSFWVGVGSARLIANYLKAYLIS